MYCIISMKSKINIIQIVIFNTIKTSVLGRIVQINLCDRIKKHMQYFKYIKYDTKVRIWECFMNKSPG